MITIELRDVQLHAFHGIFEGEEKTGSSYLINLAVTYENASSNFDDINTTINYADLFTIVKNHMEVPAGLLEKVADSIIRHISDQYPYVVEVDLTIYKLQPPIEGFQGKVGVRMNRKFNV